MFLTVPVMAHPGPCIQKKPGELLLDASPGAERRHPGTYSGRAMGGAQGRDWPKEIQIAWPSRAYGVG